ncbi:MAG: 2-hydroxychromene-2-carboxylate isomerase [Burkholderiaceae bacterium]
MINLEFHFDFGSPNAYLSHRVIPGIEQRTGVKFDYVPILLGGVFKLTSNRSPGEAFGGIRNKLDYERLETRRFIERHSIGEFRWNPNFPVNTLALMRGAVAAQGLGVFEAYVDAMFRAMWEEERAMADPAIFAEAMKAAGLPAEDIIARSASPEVKQALLDNTERSVERGSFGSPTFYVNDAIYFGKDRLRDVEEALLARKG